MGDSRPPSKPGNANSSQRRPAELVVAALLTWIAGYIDAIGFLVFAKVYTANMSGNSVALGIALTQNKWPLALFRFWPILLGIVRSISDAANPSVHLAQYLGIALLSAAMGIQNAALTRFSSFTLHTGFVTGTLVKFAEQLVAFGMLVWDTVRSGRDSREVLALFCKRSARSTLFIALTWIAYVVGAAVGAWALALGQLQNLIYPIACLMLLIAVDIYKPLAIQDEREQLSLA